MAAKCGSTWTRICGTGMELMYVAVTSVTCISAPCWLEEVTRVGEQQYDHTSFVTKLESVTSQLVTACCLLIGWEKLPTVMPQFKILDQ